MADYKHITPNWTTNGKGGDILTMIVDIDGYVELHGGRTTEVEQLTETRYCFKGLFHHEGQAVEIGFFVEPGAGF